MCQREIRWKVRILKILEIRCRIHKKNEKIKNKKKINKPVRKKKKRNEEEKN